jgi:hypothetical protein
MRLYLITISRGSFEVHQPSHHNRVTEKVLLGFPKE